MIYNNQFSSTLKNQVNNNNLHHSSSSAKGICSQSVAFTTSPRQHQPMDQVATSISPMISTLTASIVSHKRLNSSSVEDASTTGCTKVQKREDSEKVQQKSIDQCRQSLANFLPKIINPELRSAIQQHQNGIAAFMAMENANKSIRQPIQTIILKASAPHFVEIKKNNPALNYPTYFEEYISPLCKFLNITICSTSLKQHLPKSQTSFSAFDKEKLSKNLQQYILTVGAPLRQTLSENIDAIVEYSTTLCNLKLAQNLQKKIGSVCANDYIERKKNGENLSISSYYRTIIVPVCEKLKLSYALGTFQNQIRQKCNFLPSIAREAMTPKQFEEFIDEEICKCGLLRRLFGNDFNASAYFRIYIEHVSQKIDYTNFSKMLIKELENSSYSETVLSDFKKSLLDLDSEILKLFIKKEAVVFMQVNAINHSVDTNEITDLNSTTNIAKIEASMESIKRTEINLEKQSAPELDPNASETDITDLIEAIEKIDPSNMEKIQPFYIEDADLEALFNS